MIEDAPESLDAFMWSEGDILYARLPDGTIHHRHRVGTNPAQDVEEERMGGYVFRPPEPGEEPKSEPWQGVAWNRGE